MRSFAKIDRQELVCREFKLFRDEEHVIMWLKSASAEDTFLPNFPGFALKCPENLKDMFLRYC